MKYNIFWNVTPQFKPTFQYNKSAIREFSSNPPEETCVECGSNPFAVDSARKLGDTTRTITDEARAFTYEHLHPIAETTCKIIWPNNLSKESLQKDHGYYFSDLYNHHIPKIDYQMEHPCAIDIYPYYSYDDRFSIEFYKYMEVYEYYDRCVRLIDLEGTYKPPAPYQTAVENNVILYYHKPYFDLELFGIEFDESVSWVWGSLQPRKMYEVFSFPWGFESLTFQSYLPILVFTFFAFFLGSSMVFASYLLATQTPESEKLSTYECGFEPYEDARNKFDVQFYIVALLFVLFDIEIILLSPWCLSLASLSLPSYWSVIEFLLELGLGLIYVFCMGGLDWRK